MASVISPFAIGVTYLVDNVNKQRLKSSSASPSRHGRRSSTKSALRSSISSLAPSSDLSSSSSYSTPRSSLGYGNPLPQLPEGNVESDESNHAHWCTHEEHSKPVYTCEGWKRHEKEHERGFLCMPDGPVINSRHGQKCALCDTRDPSPEHLAEHNISHCIGSTKRPLRKSRKGDMMKHLALHGIFGPASAVLAEKWRFDLNKKAYSCGFCVNVFFSITDRSNHIDNEHWRCGQTMSAWDLSTTIRGLLLQPEVEAAWQDILRLNPYLVESSLRWKLPLADGLQSRLEMREEPVGVLARAALELSSSELEVSSQENLRSMTRSEAIDNSSYPGTRQLVTTATTALPRSMHSPTTNIFRSNALSSRVRPASSPWTTLNTSNSGFRTTQRGPTQNSSASITDPFESACSWNQSESLSGSFLDSGDNATDLQSLYQLPIGWPPQSLGQPPDDNARIQSLLSESGAILVAQVSSPQHGQSSAGGKSERSAHNSNLRIGFQHPTPGFMSPTTSVDGWSVQPSDQEYRPSSREKPLPNLPSETYEAAELRPKSPMDLDIG